MTGNRFDDLNSSAGFFGQNVFNIGSGAGTVANGFGGGGAMMDSVGFGGGGRDDPTRDNVSHSFSYSDFA